MWFASSEAPTTLIRKNLISMLNHKTIPFTYYIRWSKYNKWYYGVKYSIGCSPSDLWNTYFTSSKYVKEFRILYGEPDIIKVSRIFLSKESAKLWENKFLKRTSANKNPNSLNMSNPGSFGVKIYKPLNLPGNSGPKAKIDLMERYTVSLLRLTLNNKPKSLKKRFWVNFNYIIFLYLDSETERLEFLSNNLDWSAGRTKPETKNKLSLINYGKRKPPRTKEHLEKISKGNKKPKPGSGPKGTFVYHNFISEIRIPKDQIPPEGFFKGRIPGKYGNKKCKDTNN